MEYKITLGNDKYIGFRERLLAGKNTKFLFESSEYSTDELQVTVTDGSFVKRHAVRNGCFDLTQYVVKSRVLEITVDLILRGVVAKTWVIEPLVVRENGGNYVLIPEVALLRAEVKRCKKAISELNSKIKDTL